MTPRLMIRGERLRLVIQWFAWAGLHTSVNPYPGPPSKVGFAGRETVRALLERFDLYSSPPMMTGPGHFWREVLDLLSPNSKLGALELDIGGLLERERKDTFPEYLAGFERFLQAIASGEVSEADLMEKPPA